MDYEKKYREALKKAEAFYYSATTEPITEREVLANIFPELQESEDERIRKRLIEFFKDFGKTRSHCWSVSIPDILAWLEKQGKPTDKVEPKFKVGDWVVTDKNNIVQIKATNNGYYTIDNGMDFNMSYVDKCWHLWTIKDANIGDILCTYECDEPKIVFILKGTPKKPYVLSYHCYYNIMYPYFETDSKKGCLAPNDEDVKPATKEQRDFLSKKMYEAGYEWDAEKKELKKIEQKLAAWSEGDEHYELEEFAKIVRCNLTGISKAVQILFEAKYLQLTGKKMYVGFKD